MSLFGTSGIRAVVDRWLLELALKVGLAVGSIHDEVVVGCDTRTSSSAMKQALLSGLLAAGAEGCDAGVLPTPTLALAAESGAAGAMITASHNPPQYNGIKLLNADGSAFSRYQQEQIEKLVLGDTLVTAPWGGFQSLGYCPDAVENHIARIRQAFPGRYKTKVVLDCGCAAASVITPQLLKGMGCQVIPLNCQPNGFSPREIEPKRENLFGLMAEVRRCGANLGIAHDGDADRMMAVDERGEFITGDRLLVMMAKELKAGKVITTIDASMAVEEAGFEVFRTSVGDNHVSQQLKEGGDFGGEPSGSWVFPQNSLCPDGIYAAALMVTIAANNRLSELADSIAAYPLLRGSVSSSGSLPRIISRLTEVMQPLSVGNTDGIRLQFSDGWLLVRQSGTEPKIRITAEARTEMRAKQLYNKGVAIIKEAAGIEES
jgi:phosphoglucosamine mutase